MGTLDTLETLRLVSLQRATAKENRRWHEVNAGETNTIHHEKGDYEMMKFAPLGLCLMFLPIVSEVSAKEIRVTVTGIESDAGAVGCALHSSGSEFPMGQAGTQQVWVKPAGGTALCTFENISPGTYAVAIAHDLNGNKKTDTNGLGIPQEAWGVSGNVRPFLRAPRFDEAAFQVGESPVTVGIKVDK